MEWGLAEDGRGQGSRCEPHHALCLLCHPARGTESWAVGWAPLPSHGATGRGHGAQ